MKKNKGITLMILVITIIIMIIIAATVISVYLNNLNVKNLTNMYADMKTINDKVALYYNQYGTLPLKEKFTGSYDFESVANPNDNEEEYYVLDINKLDKVVLAKNLEWQDDDVYVINTKTHMVYYPEGVEVDGDTYYRLPGEYSKIIEETIKIKPSSDVDLDKWTNKDIIIDIEWPANTDDYNKLVSTDGGQTWNEYTGPITITENTEVIAKLEDSNNKEVGTGSLEISNIDKDKPNSFKPTAVPTTNSITVSGRTTDTTSNIVAYYFKIDGGEWVTNKDKTQTNYTFTGLTKGTTYTLQMKAVDEAGNEQTSEIVLATTLTLADLGEITIKPSGDVDLEKWTNEDITIEIEWPANTDDYEKLVSTDGGQTWNEYTGPITIPENTEIIAKIEDDIKQEIGRDSLEISNIDKQKPVVTIEPNGGNYVIPEGGEATIKATLAASDEGGSDVATRQYIWTTDETEPASTENWQTFTDGTEISQTGITAPGTWYLYVKVVDNAGNKAETTRSNGFVVGDTSVEGNTIKIEPQIEGEWVTGPVIVNITFGENLTKDQQIIVDGEEGTDYTIDETTNTVTLITNNKTITATAKDLAGNTVTVSTKVSKIDPNAPTVEANQEYIRIEPQEEINLNDYITVDNNGDAPITNIVYTNPSDGNSVLENTNTLEEGTYEILCTVTKANGLTATTIIKIIVKVDRVYGSVYEVSGEGYHLVLNSTGDIAEGYTEEQLLYKSEDIKNGATEDTWSEYSYNITKVIIEDEIVPRSTEYYFYYFNNCIEVVNGNNINTSKTTSMKVMFEYCDDLEYVDVSNWDTSKVTDMSGLFAGCNNLTDLDVSNWDTSNVTNMSGMFYYCINLPSLDVSNWDTSKVTDMSWMFGGGDGYREWIILTEIKGIEDFDTSNVTTMSGMFAGMSGLEELNLSNWDTSNVTDMSAMFMNSYPLVNINMSGWDTSNVTNMSEMFYRCEWIQSLDVSDFDTSNVTDMNGMFRNCVNLEALDVSDFNTSNVTDMSFMFSACSNLQSLDVSNFDTSNVTNMYAMFYYCENLAYINLSNFDTRSVTDIRSMFEDCPNLVSLDLSNFDTSNVTSMSFMFEACENLLFINFGNWDTSNTANMKSMFNGCSKLQRIYVSNNWNVDTVTSSTDMFRSCTNLVGAISYDSSKTDKNYANYTTGYFTYSSSEIIIKPSTTEWTTSDITVTIEWNVDTTELSKMVSIDGGTTWEEYTGDITISENCEIKAKTVNQSNEDVDIAILQIKNIDKNAPIITADTATIDQGENNSISDYFTIETNGTAPIIKIEYIDLKNNNTVYNTNTLLAGTHTIQCKATKANNMTSTNNIVINVKQPEEGVYGNTYKVSETEYHLVLNTRGELAEGYTEQQIVQLGTNIKDGATTYQWYYEDIIRKVIIEERINPTSTENYFHNLQNMKEIVNINNINTSNVTDTSYMFYRCYSLQSLDVTNFDTSNVTDMRCMFYQCYSLQSLDVTNFDTSNVTDMSFMFYYCYSLQSLDVTNFGTSNVTDMSFMFCDCDSLQSLDLTSFDTSNVTNMSDMFSSSGNLKTIYASDSWNVGSVTSSDGMFYGCRNLVGAISFTSSKTDAEYANWTTGYLTYKPLITFTLTPAGYTVDNVTVTAEYEETVTGIQSLVCTGEEGIDYIRQGNAIIVMTPNQTVTATAKNKAGTTITKSVIVDTIDRNAPIILANEDSVTYKVGVDRDLNTLFTINANGKAPIETTVFTVSSDGDRIVDNLTDLALGTHTIECTATKANGLSAQVTITVTIVEDAYPIIDNIEAIRTDNGLKIKVDAEDGTGEEIDGYIEEYAETYGFATILSNERPEGVGELTTATNSIYGFDIVDNTLVSSNKGKNSSVADSYIEINLEEYDSSASIPLTVSTTISSESRWDKGYVIVSNSPNKITSYSNSIINNGSEVSGTGDYIGETTLAGGTKHYLHFIYTKDLGGNSGNDNFVINDITIQLPIEDTRLQYEYNVSEQGYTQQIPSYIYEYISDSITTPANVTVRVTNEAGNTAERTIVLLGEIVITPSTTDWTTEDITVEVTWPEGSNMGIKQIKIGDNDWKNYTGPETITENCVVIARVIPSTAQIQSETVTLTITNIDKNLPIVTPEPGIFTVQKATNKSLADYFKIDANGDAPLTIKYTVKSSGREVTNTRELLKGNHTIECTVTKSTGYSASATQYIGVHTTTGVWGNVYKMGDNEYHLVLNTDGSLAEGYTDSQFVYGPSSISAGASSLTWGNFVNKSYITKVIIEEELNPTSMYYWFYNLTGLKEIQNINNINTSNVTNMNYMFNNCTGLTSLDLSRWNTSKVTGMAYMFRNCSNLATIYASDLWSTASVTTSTKMFDSCPVLKGAISYDSTKTDQNYANWETGYLTYKSLTAIPGGNSISIIPDTTDWAEEVTVTVTWPEHSTGLTRQISTDGGETWNTYTEPVTITENCVVVARLVDGAGQTGETATLTINKIDPNAPTITVKEANVTIEPNTNSALETYFNIDQNGEAPITTTFIDTSNNNKEVTNTSTLTSGTHIIQATVTKANGTTATATVTINVVTIGVFGNLYKISDTEYHLIFNSTGALAQGYTEEQLVERGTDIVNGSTRDSDLETSLQPWGQYSANITKVKIEEKIQPTKTDYYFYGLSAITQIEGISNIDTSNATSMHGMFDKCRSLISVDLTGWDTSKVTTMRNMFMNCESLTTIKGTNFNTKNVTNMDQVFFQCYALTSVDVSEWDTSKVTSMSNIFYFCQNLTGLDVSGWNTSNVTYMYGMFTDCNKLTEIDVSGWDTSKVTNMDYLFDQCQSLTSLDVSGWDTSNVTNMKRLFSRSPKLTSLDLSSFNTTKVTSMEKMFADCTNLTTIYAGDNWTIQTVTNSLEMFKNCPKLKGAISYDANKIDAAYANWTTGYLTYK